MICLSRSYHSTINNMFRINDRVFIHSMHMLQRQSMNKEWFTSRYITIIASSLFGQLWDLDK